MARRDGNSGNAPGGLQRDRGVDSGRPWRPPAHLRTLGPPIVVRSQGGKVVIGQHAERPCCGDDNGTFYVEQELGRLEACQTAARILDATADAAPDPLLAEVIRGAAETLRRQLALEAFEGRRS